MTTETWTLQDLAARLATLEHEQVSLQRENAALRSELQALRVERDQDHLATPQRRTAAAGASSDRTSRRGLLRTALGTAAATAGAGALLAATSGTAAANTGDPVILGQTNVANAGTQVKWNGASGFTGVILLGNDTGFGNSGSFYPAAAGGWAGGSGGTFAGVPHGVYGFTEATPTVSVTPTGVVGLATQGTGVRGETQSTSVTALGVQGVSPNGTGVVGCSTTGTGVAGTGGSSSPGIGVVGKGNTGVSATGTSTGVSATATGTGGFGVVATASIAVTGTSSTSSGIGVQGSATGTGGRGVIGNGTSMGCMGISRSGYGGYFMGALAPLHLTPSTTAGPPTTGPHQQGDLMVDNTGLLFICTVAGTPGTWVRVGAQ